MPLAARKRYPEALECLLVALTAPSMVTNAIVVAAFKKWTLVNLIHNGKLPALPRWTPVAVSRAVKLEGGPYQVSLCTAEQQGSCLGSRPVHGLYVHVINSCSARSVPKAASVSMHAASKSYLVAAS